MVYSIYIDRDYISNKANTSTDLIPLLYSEDNINVMINIPEEERKDIYNAVYDRAEKEENEKKYKEKLLI